MFNESLISIVRVEYDDQMQEVYDCIVRDGIMSGVQLEEDITIEHFEKYITTYSIIFYNVYYENLLLGYIVIDIRSSNTIEFNWGVCQRHKYITKMIDYCFEFVKTFPFINIMGTINPKNKLSLKVAQKTGFKLCYILDNYYKQDEHAMIMKYDNEVK